MKKFCSTTSIAVSLLFFLNGVQVQAQTATAGLDQLKLNKSFVGSWQYIGKDTINIWEVQSFEKATLSISWQYVKDKKSLYFGEDWVYIPEQDNFKGFVSWPVGGYGTWIGKFTSEKKFNGNFVRNFNPEEVIAKYEIIFDTPTSFTISHFNADGVKIGENKMNKVK